MHDLLMVLFEAAVKQFRPGLVTGPNMPVRRNGGCPLLASPTTQYLALPRHRNLRFSRHHLP